MIHRIILGGNFLLLLVTLALPTSLNAQTTIPMRVSTENSASHIQAQIVAAFVEQVNQHLGDAIAAQHFHSGTLFRDKDVITALSRGQVEMAVPGNWHLDRFEPSAGLFLLPSYYGLDREPLDSLRDGKLGDEINAALQQRTGAIVLGRWIDLGFAHLYTLNKPIKNYDDIAGMRIRVAGGMANIERIRALGGNAISIPWGELQQALNEGRVDGVLTTHESIASARLWEVGIRYCFEDNNYFPMYLPLLSSRFVKQLDPTVLQKLRSIWEQQVDEARTLAATAQKQARVILQQQGIEIITPTANERKAARQRLLIIEPQLAEELGIAANFLQRSVAP